MLLNTKISLLKSREITKKIYHCFLIGALVSIAVCRPSPSSQLREVTDSCELKTGFGLQLLL